MKEMIKLFKGVIVQLNEQNHSYTIKGKFLIDNRIISEYSEEEVSEFIRIINKEFFLSGSQLNSSFHKSWDKVKTADISQLVAEQIAHYLTTYGFEALGIYDSSFVYIPLEDLDIPDLKEIPVFPLHGFTVNEVQKKIIKLLSSGIAMKQDTLTDIFGVIKKYDITIDIEKVKNKEAKIFFYEQGILPKNNVEFLRFMIYKTTGLTLLIKNEGMVTNIKTGKGSNIYQYFNAYIDKYGYIPLAEIFNRFKPLFLAFKVHVNMTSIINKISKLSKYHHKPMDRDYLNDLTARIENGEAIDLAVLREQLNRVPIFRVIRILNSLKQRMLDLEVAVYRIRNGKTFTKEVNLVKDVTAYEKVYSYVYNYICHYLYDMIGDKKIFIPDYINYALPTSEKSFVGNFPTGTSISVKDNAIIGVYWENLPDCRIDLDLKMMSLGVSFGWDANYRSTNGQILFSGDVTDAPEGATELFYINKNHVESYLMSLNDYTYRGGSHGNVPFKFFIAEEEIRNMKKNYMVDPNKVVFQGPMEMENVQKMLGVVNCNNDNTSFYFIDADAGNQISARNNKWTEQSRTFYITKLLNSVSLFDVLSDAGVEFVDSPEEADINLDPVALQKDTIINLFLE
jgi:hypothetical protein